MYLEIFQPYLSGNSLYVYMVALFCNDLFNRFV